MPKQYEIVLAPAARRDLRGIYTYIDANSSRSNASKMAIELLDAINTLSELPHRYDVPRTGSPRSRKVRAMPVPPYIVRYRIDDSANTVLVLRIRHGARKQP